MILRIQLWLARKLLKLVATLIPREKRNELVNKLQVVMFQLEAK